MTGTLIALAGALLAVAGTPQPGTAMAEAAIAGTATAGNARDGRWPVDNPTIVSAFRPAEPDWSSGHRGLDLMARTGTAVRAIAAGRVSFAGSVAGKPVVTVTLPGAGTLRTTFEPVTAAVSVGQRVRGGDLIGFVAAVGGHCGGDAGCLHVGLRTDDRYLDPLRLITMRPAVLKPRASVRSSARVGQGEGGPEPLHRHMRVPLRR